MNEYSLIETIRKRPGMYLGSPSITALMNFLHGYQFALHELCKFDDAYPGNLFPLDFYFMHEYTALLFDLKESTAGWRNHILWNCGGDEEKALNRFFEILDEFKEIRAEKCWRAVLSAENIGYNNGMEHVYYMCGAASDAGEKQPIYDDPLCAYVIKLTIPAYMLVVETADEFRVKSAFYRSFEDAVGSKNYPDGAEVYFGKIAGWTETESIDEYLNGKPVGF